MKLEPGDRVVWDTAVGTVKHLPTERLAVVRFEEVIEPCQRCGALGPSIETVPVAELRLVERLPLETR